MFGDKAFQAELSQLLRVELDTIMYMEELLLKQGYDLHQSKILAGTTDKGVVLSLGEVNQRKIAIRIRKYYSEKQCQSLLQTYKLQQELSGKNILGIYDILILSRFSFLIIVQPLCPCKHNNLLEIQIFYLHSIICVFDVLSVSLKTYLSQLRSSKGRIRMDYLLRICLELSEGLSEIHLNNIIHLNINPTNIMFSSSGSWKYSDFEHVRQIKFSEDGKSEMINQINQSELNNSLYSSPEQQQYSNSEGTLTHKSDIYSLGLVFLELLGVDISSSHIQGLKEGKVSTVSILVLKEFKQLLQCQEYKQFFNWILQNLVIYHNTLRLSADQVQQSIKRMIENMNQVKGVDHNIANSSSFVQPNRQYNAMMTSAYTSNNNNQSTLATINKISQTSDAFEALTFQNIEFQQQQLFQPRFLQRAQQKNVKK